MTNNKIKKIEEDANKIEFILNDGTTTKWPVSALPSDDMESLYSEIIGRIIDSELSIEDACDLARMIGNCGPGDIRTTR